MGRIEVMRKGKSREGKGGKEEQKGGTGRTHSVYMDDRTWVDTTAAKLIEGVEDWRSWRD